MKTGSCSIAYSILTRLVDYFLKVFPRPHLPKLMPDDCDLILLWVIGLLIDLTLWGLGLLIDLTLWGLGLLHDLEFCTWVCIRVCL